METNASTKEMASAVYKKTKKDLRKAAKKKGHSIEKRINRIQVGADEETFISFVLSDTFPDEFTDGESVGFADVSGFDHKLPDGQYEVKIYFDEKNLDKQSEFINVTTGKKYLFDTETEKIKDPSGRTGCEFGIKKGCTWIQVQITSPSGNIFIRWVCLDCPECYG